MIATAVTRIGWLTAAALGALAVLVVVTPPGLDAGPTSQQAALEHCRAEVTRAFLVKHRAPEPRSFEACMARQGH